MHELDKEKSINIYYKKKMEVLPTCKFKNKIKP